MKFPTLGVRTLVAAIFGPLIILSTLRGGLLFLGLVGIIVTVSMYEFFQITSKRAVSGQQFTGILGAIVLLVVIYFRGAETVWLVFTMLLLVVLVVELYRKVPAATINVSVTIFGVGYLSFLFGHLLLIRELPNVVNIPYAYGGRWIVMMFLVIWACDTAAYLAGSAWGKHKLMERISPKKTIEGTAAGFLVAILTALLCHYWFIEGIALRDSLIIGAICGSIGQYGDLVESMFKRDVGVKDTSTIIPGHGGMMDRFDSPLLSAPVVFIYLKFVVF